MSDNEEHGRGSYKSSDLTNAAKERIRREEEYRAKVRSELQSSTSGADNASKNKKIEKSSKLVFIPTEAQLEEERKLQEQERANPTLKKRNPLLMGQEEYAIYDRIRRENFTPQEQAVAARKANAGLIFVVVALLISGFVLIRSCAGEYSANRAAKAARANSLAGQSPYEIQAACEIDIGRKLKAPSTAKFFGSGKPEYSSGQWSWVGEVEAENSFGVPLRSPFACTVSGTTKEDATISTALLE